jgi:hypothetical protein
MSAYLSRILGVGVVVSLASLLAVACGGSDDAGLSGNGGKQDGGAASGGGAGKGSGGIGGSSGASGSGSGGKGGSGGSQTGGASGSGGAGGDAGSSGGSGGSGGSTTCVNSLDCDPGTICDPLDEICVDCLFDADCEAGERCVAETCETVVTCNNSLDCVSVTGRPICDPETKLCEQCVSAADCSGTADCVDHECVVYTPCINSLDCAQNQVCDTSAGRCVGCIGDTDCANGQKCVSNACIVQTECQSDLQCTPVGMLCDTTDGVCVRCTRHVDCPDVYHCAGGDCVLDVCSPNEAACSGNAVVSCNAVGDGFTAPAPCAAKQTCVANGSDAQCRDWVCDAGLTYCDANVAIECSADGFQIVDETDCTPGDLICVDGQCRTQLCTPNQNFCDGNQVKHCDAAGQTASVIDTCTASEYCDDVSKTCKTRVCTPNAPACNGNFATTCNGDGSGYTSPGVNCAPQSCFQGACQNCPGGAGVVQSVRIVEVFIGDGDYVILENRHATCSAQLSGMQLRLYETAGSDNIDFTLPTFTLNPGARVLVTESTAGAGEISTGTNIFWSSSTGGYAMLCTGACTTAGTPNVVDAFSYQGTQAPPALPSPVAFSPGPHTGITSSNETTQAFKRSAYAGAYPTYLRADWVVGAASYAGSSCPATQPSGICTTVQTCVYGLVTCTCGSIFSTWTCI